MTDVLREALVHIKSLLVRQHLGSCQAPVTVFHCVASNAASNYAAVLQEQNNKFHRLIKPKLSSVCLPVKSDAYTFCIKAQNLHLEAVFLW